MIICLDTHVLIWGIRGQAERGQEVMIGRTRILLEALAERAKANQIVVPAPVIGEFLIGVEEERHPETLAELSTRFMVVPYDSAAAAHAAAHWRRLNGGRALSEEVRLSVKNATRQEIKVDTQIIGIALARKVDLVYSGDPHLRTLAQGRVRIENIPEALQQLELRETRAPFTSS